MKSAPMTAIVTGAGSGIGRATALELASSGIVVYALGRRPQPLEEVVADIRNAGGRAEARSVDVRDHRALEQIVEEAVAHHGSIDILVANAAVHDTASVVDGDPEWWHELIDTNVLGVMNSCHAVLPIMLRQGTGHVVVVSSVSGRVTYPGEPVYLASKHATVAFADALRQAVAVVGIRVTVIEPGMVDTPMLANPFAAGLARSVRPLEPADCARAIRFAIDQPPNCSINEIVLRPTAQVL
jgi:NADP-dependent 3-hydroxy acid dehydrogenase YdfG